MLCKNLTERISASEVYKNLKDQQDFLKAEFKLLIQGYKRENNISFFVQNFKNQFDLRSKWVDFFI